MNKVILMGRLTADPEITRTQSGVAIATFNIAVDRGDKEKNTDFIRCKAFDKQADFAGRYLHKGIKIAIEGSWRTGSFQSNDGKTVYTNDCFVQRCEFCESKSSGSAADTPSAAPARGNAWQYPQSDPAYAPTPQGQTNQGYLPQDFDNISDPLDLPF